MSNTSPQTRAFIRNPMSAPTNANVRGEFLLGIFPPDHGGNHTPPPAPTPPPQQTPPAK